MNRVLVQIESYFEYWLLGGGVDFEKVDQIAGKLVAHIRGWPFDDALDFLAELTGAWILSCPKAIIQKHFVFGKEEAHRVKTDDDFDLLLLKWLHRALW